MATRPSVLWVTLESVRADHTPMYGYHRDTTPEVRREAARSDATTLSPAVSQSMWTPAATASILTGTYLSTHQLGQEGTPLSPLRSELTTLPALFSEAGYRTALFTGNDYVGETTGLDRGFDTVERSLLDTADLWPQAGTLALDNWRAALRRLWELDEPRLDRLRSDVAHNTTAVVPRRFRRWVTDEPFFAYAHLQAPHHPYRPPSADRQAVVGATDTADATDATGVADATDATDISADEAARVVDRVYDGSDEIKRRIAEGDMPTEREWTAIRAMYDAEIRFTDRVAGALIRAARAAADKLIVVVTGDHGDLFGECGVIGHNLLLHDGLIRVPLIVSGLDCVDHPQSVTQHIDVTRTLGELVGGHDQFEGHDVRTDRRPFGVSQRGTAPLDAYERHDPSFGLDRVTTDPITAVRTTAFKYVTDASVSGSADASSNGSADASATRSADERHERLYALPDETNDVRADHPDRLARFRDRYDDLPTAWTDPADDGTADFDETARRRLRDLGYVTE